MHEPLVVLGKIVKAHGLRGEAKVVSDVCEPENFRLPEVFLRSPDGSLELVKVIAYRPHKGAYILRLAEFSDINQILTKVGWELVCRGSQLPALPADEYYHFQLLGLSVCDLQTGKKLGILKEIMDIPANEVYVIKLDSPAQEEELLLPAVGAYIKEIDLDAGRITVDPAGTPDSAGADSGTSGE